jgi:hypothetical protein
MTTIITRKVLLPNLILPLLCKTTSEFVDKDSLPIMQDINVVEVWNIQLFLESQKCQYVFLFAVKKCSKKPFIQQVTLTH